MKLKSLQKAAVMITAGMISTTSFAQQETRVPTVEQTIPFGPLSDYRTWSVGVNAGILNQSNILGFNRAGFDKLTHNVGYSAYIKKQISPSFGLKAQYLGGKVSGQNESSSTEFDTEIPWSAALSAEWTLANTNWRFVNSLIKPYVAIGLGTLNYEPSLTVNGTTTSGGSQTKLYIPVDAGFKFAIAKGINLDLGYQLNWTNQHFDGVTGDQYKNDLFAYAHAGLEFALGSTNKPSLSNSNPVATLVNDYTAKYDDLKAQRDALKAQGEELKAANAALQKQLQTLTNDLKDDDGDGVANKFDKCPNTPAGIKVDGSGCPLPEMKHETKIIEKVIVTEEDKKIVTEAIQNLEFDLSKATIRERSFPSLNRVAALLIEKNFSLKLAGHTDNTGSRELNLRLSKDRAESVKNYLVSKGANPSRIEATGYGPDQPIATNTTAEGRQQNRRVEFTLY